MIILSSKMFAAIYHFEVIPGQEEKFKIAWTKLTELIYQYEGSLGSRLHLDNHGRSIAYAQWPNKERWKTSGDRLPEITGKYRQQMREACSKIETLFELEEEIDLLQNTVFKNQ